MNDHIYNTKFCLLQGLGFNIYRCLDVYDLDKSDDENQVCSYIRIHFDKPCKSSDNIKYLATTGVYQLKERSGTDRMICYEGSWTFNQIKDEDYRLTNSGYENGSWDENQEQELLRKHLLLSIERKARRKPEVVTCYMCEKIQDEGGFTQAFTGRWICSDECKEDYQVSEGLISN